jgi:hypothetical protein
MLFIPDGDAEFTVDGHRRRWSVAKLEARDVVTVRPRLIGDFFCVTYFLPPGLGTRDAPRLAMPPGGAAHH